MANIHTNPAVEIGCGTYYKSTARFVTFEIPHEKIIVGKYCSIAEYAVIIVGGGHCPELPSTWPMEHFLQNKPNPTRSYRSSKNTVIGNDVWIAFEALISSGCQIGHGAVIASRAAVFTDVPPYAVMMGNPAKIVRYRFSESTIERMLRIAWWDWPIETIRERMEWFYKPILEFVEKFDPVAEKQ